MSRSGGPSELPRVVLVVAVIVVAILAVTNVVLFEATRSLQLEVNARAQYLQQTAQLEPLFRELVQGIAGLAMRNNDDALRGVLAEQGITFSASSPTGTPPGPGPTPPGGGKP